MHVAHPHLPRLTAVTAAAALLAIVAALLLAARLSDAGLSSGQASNPPVRGVTPVVAAPANAGGPAARPPAGVADPFAPLTGVPLAG